MSNQTPVTPTDEVCDHDWLFTFRQFCHRFYVCTKCGSEKGVPLDDD